MVKILDNRVHLSLAVVIFYVAVLNGVFAQLHGERLCLCGRGGWGGLCYVPVSSAVFQYNCMYARRTETDVEDIVCAVDSLHKIEGHINIFSGNERVVFKCVLTD